jgi:signal transduction histidine kinase
VFSDLSGAQLAWLAEHMEERRFEAGTYLARAGDPADHMIAVLEGEYEVRTASGGPAGFIGEAGAVSGMLPGSRLVSYPNNILVTKPLWIALLHKDLFWRMIDKMPEVAPRLISILTDRVRWATRQEQQQEKLASLGKLSAGLAHELNNPASAVRQGAAGMRAAVLALQGASMRLSRQPLTVEQKENFFAIEREAIESASKEGLDPIERSDREQQASEWLEAHGIEEPWKQAPALTDAGLSTSKLDQIAGHLPPAIVRDAMIHLSAVLALEQLVRDLETSAGRISELVQAIKEYSFMDQAPDQELDVHKGLESTLTILGHKLKRGITVIRDYDTSLPRIRAHGSELNQVWTNLIDNAIAAMKGNGEIRIRTWRDLNWLVVDIVDNGPGIPKEIQPKIFDPFFTTKEVGEGTGLGLETVLRIVKQHRGEVGFESVPGRTCFRIRLPIPEPAK